MNNEEFLDNEFKSVIDRFKEHDKQSQELYDEFKPVIDSSIRKSKNSITINSGLKDLSEGIRALSSLRSDGINATSQRSNAIFKQKDAIFKEKRLEKGDETSGDIAQLMRELSNKIETKPMSTQPKKQNNENESFLLEKRFKEESEKGNIKINENEEYMKYDFDGIEFKWSDNDGRVVGVTKKGEIIQNYPEERIPFNERFKEIKDGIPYNNIGFQIQKI